MDDLSKKRTVVENPSLTNTNGKRPVTLKQLTKTRRDIRILKVQKDLNTAIVDVINTHLDKATADRTINGAVREQLLDKFLTEAKQLEKDIDKKTLLIKLYELEKAQKDLIKQYQAQIRKLYHDMESVKGTLPPVKNPEREQSEIVNEVDFTVDSESEQTKANFLIDMRTIRWPSSIKLILAGGVVLAFTFLGLRFGMRMFLSLVSLLIGSAFFLSVFRD